MMELLMKKVLPFVAVFCSAMALTLLFVPLVRRMNVRLGMVDRPDERRINKIPIPRGGGIALIAGVLVSYSLFVLFSEKVHLGMGSTVPVYWKYVAISLFVALVGFVDDLRGLRPRVKLLGQLIAGFLVWAWADLGFHCLWPSVPPALNCVLTVCWVVGAINAFNLIDGLDGLASGLAFIATIGMGGALLLFNSSHAVYFYFAFAGGLLGFLRYNYNPASIFLGDTGSMFIGFTLAFLSLVSQEPQSFLISVGMPILAMGVPIFDVFLAILRRSVRYVLGRQEAKSAGNGKIMAADVDHLHHRILRSVGANQRKAAWVLYITAALFIASGLLGIFMESRAAGLWVATFSLAVVVAVRDMSRIELFDLGRLVKNVAHDNRIVHRRKIANLRIPLTLAFDAFVLFSAFFLCVWMLRINVGRITLRVGLPLMAASVFAMLVLCRNYVTAWSRALPSNYMRLLFACIAGSVMGGVVAYYSPFYNYQLKALIIAYAVFAFFGLAAVRYLRVVMRDFLYNLEHKRLHAKEGTSRILVYGAGVRYAAFRRELVRSAAANNRIIVGIVDDNILLKGLYIGGIKIYGSLSMVPGLIRELKVDTVVVACAISDARLNVVRSILAGSGVKIAKFYVNEVPVDSLGQDNQGETK